MITKHTQTYVEASVPCSLDEYIELCNDFHLDDYEEFKDSYPEMEWSDGFAILPMVETFAMAGRMERDYKLLLTKIRT
tara:strand:+ start:878 stop:1111 length:234 start_codon:yes stop_codon:yes gene_type:complete